MRKWTRPALIVFAGWMALAVQAPPVADASHQLDAAEIQACMAFDQLMLELRSGVLPRDIARQRIILVHDLARTSRTPSIQHLAATLLSLSTTPGDATFMAVAGQFSAACR